MSESSIKGALLELEERCRVHIGRDVSDSMLRPALIFAQRSLRALKFGKPPSAEFCGFLSARELRELSAWLPPGLREIAAQAAPDAVSAPALSFLPVLNDGERWGPPPELSDDPRCSSLQRWSACGRTFTSTHRGLGAIYCALLSPGEFIDGGAFIAPHRQNALAAALHYALRDATKKIQEVHPGLASALRFEVSRTGRIRYTGTAKIHAA